MGRIFISFVLFFIVAGGVLVYQATRGTSSLVVMPSELSEGSCRQSFSHSSGRKGS